MLHALRLLAPLIFAASLAAGEDFPLRPAVEFQPRDGLPNVLAKLTAGGEVRVAYFGGSITAAPGWRVKSLAWLRSRYPAAKISEINAAIGGTGSDLGTYRLAFDVLRHKPDLIFVEFAVNDGGAPVFIRQNMEGIVRQVWKADPTTDLCYVYTLNNPVLKDLQGGHFQRSATAMDQLADHYGIPSIHFGVEVAARVTAGTLVFQAAKPTTDEQRAALAGKTVFSGDGVHPSDDGHAIYAEVLQRNLATLAAAPAKPAPHTLKPALEAGNTENARVLPLDSVALGAGWTKLDPATDQLAKQFGPRLPSLYAAKTPGTSLSFSFTGTAVGIYDLLGPDCGQLQVSVDGGKPRTIPRIDSYCSYHRLAACSIASGLTAGVHTVTITLDEARPDKAKILAPSNRPDLEKNPAKYAAANWYAGGIMVVGELK